MEQDVWRKTHGPSPWVTGASSGIGYELAKCCGQDGFDLVVVADGRIDPSFVITDRASLQDGPELYKKFRDRENGCFKVVMKPPRAPIV